MFQFQIQCHPLDFWKDFLSNQWCKSSALLVYFIKRLQGKSLLNYICKNNGYLTYLDLYFCYFFYFSQFMLMGAKLFWQKSISLLFSDRILGYLNTNTVCLSIQIVGSFLVSYCHWGVSEFTQSNVIKNDQETFSKLTSSASPIKKLYLGRAFVT